MYELKVLKLILFDVLVKEGINGFKVVFFTIVSRFYMERFINLIAISHGVMKNIKNLTVENFYRELNTKNNETKNLILPLDY